jgi:hypothetical protein
MQNLQRTDCPALTTTFVAHQWPTSDPPPPLRAVLATLLSTGSVMS